MGDRFDFNLSFKVSKLRPKSSLSMTKNSQQEYYTTCDKLVEKSSIGIQSSCQSSTKISEKILTPSRKKPENSVSNNVKQSIQILRAKGSHFMCKYNRNKIKCKRRLSLSPHQNMNYLSNWMPPSPTAHMRGSSRLSFNYQRSKVMNTEIRNTKPKRKSIQLTSINLNPKLIVFK